VTRILIAVAACLLLLSMRPVAQRDDASAALAGAEATWDAKKPAAYEFTIEVRCFCRLSRKPPSFRVADGQSVPIRELDAEVLTTYQSYDSIDKLFTVLRRIATMGPHKMAVKYDGELGYPVSADIDLKQRVKDDELMFRVSGFKALPAPIGQLR
jgi:hypothetical protein